MPSNSKRREAPPIERSFNHHNHETASCSLFMHALTILKGLNQEAFVKSQQASKALL